MKLIIGTTLSLLSLISTTTVSAEKLPLYACSTCDFGLAASLAREKSPELRCEWTNPTGSIATPDDQVCNTTNKIVTFANSITKQAFKFNVISEPNDKGGKNVIVKSMSFSNIESELINRFYEIDTDFRKANGTVTTMGSSNAVMSSAWQASDANSSCGKGHPVDYLRPKTRVAIHKNMIKVITARIGDTTWGNFNEDTNVIGHGVTIDLGGVAYQVSVSHNKQKVFSQIKWDNHNKLVFEVTYYGESKKNGKRNLRLGFKLQDSPSRIDGISVEHLLPKKGNTDLRNTVISNCLKDYIDEIATETIVHPPSSRGPGGGMCLKEVSTTAGERPQNFLFLVPC